MPHTRRGFTLVEMALVLIIVGLVLGGVVIGRDMIKAAMIRKQITQFEQFSVAATTFRVKYSAFPGDIAASKATAFGFVSRAGTNGHGDDDSVIEGCGTYWEVGCEAAMFWRDLSEAHLIKEAFSTATDTDPTIADDDDAALYYPKAILGSNKFILLGLDPSNISWFVLADSLNFDPGTPFYFVQVSTPVMDTYIMDTKMDDGAPYTGRVKGRITTINGPTYSRMMSTDPTAGSNACANAATNEYANLTPGALPETSESCIPAVRR